MGRLFTWSSTNNTTTNANANNANNNNATASSRIVKRTAASPDPPLPSSPVRPRASSVDNVNPFHNADVPDLTPRRRYNSRDYPRSYSGQYGQVDDLLPLELNRHRAPNQSSSTLIGLYVTIVLLVHFMVAFLLLVPAAERGIIVSPLSWTWTNAIHCCLTLLYLHWIKGSLYDDSGEMNALTLWEQWEASGQLSRPVREAAMVVPCVLCWAACHASDYEVWLSALNGIIWVAT